ncbi:hypothetical protein [Corynebacterium coyleae]|uniref:Uncharacterized protein n=1 Tax=Corynebacterium coyleae TaxID=53374 RepID=A0ABX8KVS0_9CORY|nr:hypothetical protein [Corynebacterium coyleae]QXB17978.1 hypothetical protein I6L55_08805 [Corynebacterium coyleae]
MTVQMERKRRRVVRRADVEYDRTADKAPSQQRKSPAFDGEREVLLDDEEPGLTGRAFYEEQRPPHHGD